MKNIICFLSGMVQNAWRPAFFADHECMVPALIHEYGWQFSCQPVIRLRR